MKKRSLSVGIVSLAATVMVALVPSAAIAATGGHGVDNAEGSLAAPRAGVSAPGDAGVDLASPFPSASSTVVGSVGFIDAEQAGYFWSAARGDSVAETLPGPNNVRKAVIKFDVLENVLNNGAFVQWKLSINGVDVGNFKVVEGQLGPFTKKFTFPKKTGGSYDVKIRVLNEVAGGEGSHTLRYAGDGQHSINLKRR